MLRKLLKFCSGSNDPASFDEQFISLDFLPNEILPRASACTFYLFLPLKCTGEEELKQMMNMAVILRVKDLEIFDGYLEAYIKLTYVTMNKHTKGKINTET